MKHISCRTAFISDIHLGTPGCQTKLLLDFLDHLQCPCLYLVGDIIDLEAMQRRPWWQADHSKVLVRLWQIAHRGTRLIYIPGNHDAQLRPLAGTEVGGWLSIQREAIHLAADGRRFRVSHGDEFDDPHLDRDWRLILGERLHRLLCLGHRLGNRVRRGLDRGYRPYSVLLKPRIPAVRRYLQQYADRVYADTVKRGLDGHIGGHIHLGQQIHRNGITLLNDGDWVEHCTALLEHDDGQFELAPWGRDVAMPAPSARQSTRSGLDKPIGASAVIASSIPGALSPPGSTPQRAGDPAPWPGAGSGQ